MVNLIFNYVMRGITLNAHEFVGHNVICQSENTYTCVKFRLIFRTIVLQTLVSSYCTEHD